jgi:recombinational DNA repair protein (RecF pathway)
MVDTYTPPNDPAEVVYRLLDTTSQALLDGAPALPIVTYAEVWTLRLAGTFPSIRDCVECGAALGRPLRFDTGHYGFVCEAHEGRHTTTVPNEVADALATLLRLPAAELAAKAYSSDLLMEIRLIAASVRRNFLGHELKSYDVLAGLIS